MPPIVQFTTPAGSQEAAPQPATIDAALSVVFDDFVFDGPQARTLSAGLAALFGKGRKDSMEFVALAPGAVPRVRTASSRQQVSMALKSLAAGAGSSDAPLPFAALLAYLRSVAAPASGWKQVLFVGPEPPLPPELREYAYGLLLRTLLERHIRFSQSYPEGTAEPTWAPVLRAAAGDVAPSIPAGFGSTSGQQIGRAHV